MAKNLLILVAIVLGLMTGGVLVKKKSNQPAKECPIVKNYWDNDFEYKKPEIKSDSEPLDFQRKEIKPEIKRLPEEKPQPQPRYYYQPGNPPSS